MKKPFRKIILIFSIYALSLSFNALNVSAEEKIHAGVAANYIQVFRELATVYEAKTGIKIDATFTSSGSLYSQITNGAPYDIFLSADEDRPVRLYNAGLAEKPFTYAEGHVILWSAKKDFCKSKDWTAAVKSGAVKKISMANPETAPYGLAALKALQKRGLHELLKPKIVNSQDIAQSFQYASTEAVDAGFCALSSAYSPQGIEGCFYEIKEAPAIIQSASVLKSSRNIKAAEKFAAFIISEEAVKIKKKYGYR